MVVGKDGIILSSNYAKKWTMLKYNNDDYLKYIAYGNGKWIIVGHEGVCIVSKGCLQYVETKKPKY